MFKNLLDFVCGWRYAEISKADRTRAFDMMYKNDIAFVDEKSSGEKTIIRLRGRNANAFSRFAQMQGIEYSLSKPHGSPMVLKFMKHRPAIPIGLLIFAVWMFYSTKLIWDIRIEGTEKTEPAEIIALLDELGCGVGDNYKSINFNDLHAKYAAAQHDIAWLSVYMNGTVAEVQVRELWRDERIKAAENTYANVIAASDGIVESVNVIEGQPCVKPGDIVRAGQVVISGVVENKDGSIRYEYAAGEVICRTAAPIHVEVNTKRDEKQYTGREVSKKSIKFFKKSINLFVKCGTLYTDYDKIYMIEQLCPFDLCEIPVWIENTIYREYEMVSVSIPAADAADEAMAELNEKIRAATNGAELLSKKTDAYFADGVYNIDCLMYLCRDIAVTEEFTVAE